jgi:hypothetical protein
MGNITTKNVRNALVVYDPATGVSEGNRWYDAFGAGVGKYLQSFTSLPADDTTTDPTEFVNTITEVGAGVSTAVLADVAGGALLITTAANEDDGYAMQLGNPNTGENVQLNGDYPTYFGIRFQINDVDQTDCLFGLCVTDTDAIGGVTDGVFFRSVDASAVLNFVIEKNSVESITAVGTLADATNITVEFFYDGNNIKAYVNSTLMTTIADSDASFPDDEALRLTMEFLTGEATANTCQIDWVRLIHIRN